MPGARWFVRRDRGQLSAPGGPAVVTPTVKQYWLDGRLHRPDGPAVITPSGTRCYFWRGVFVPREAIMDPRSKAPTEILSIENAEVRRAWLESYGLEDALKELLDSRQASIIHEQTNPPRRLWKILARDVDEQYYVYVEVTCPSTDRVYHLRVPPTIRTCSSAVAWTFDLDSKDYVPTIES